MVYSSANEYKVYNLEDSVSLPSQYFSSIGKDDFGTFWFGTLNAGAIKLKINENKYSVEQFNESKGIVDPCIWNIFTYGNHILLAGNDHGFYKLDNAGVTNISIQNGLPGNQILAIFRDSQRNIWLGSMGNGLILWRGETLIHYTREQGLPGQKIYAVRSNGDGSLWVGSDEKGLAQLSFDHNKLQARYLICNRVLKQPGSSIDFDHDNQLIIGTWGDGVARLMNNRFHYITKSDGLADNQVNCVRCSAKGSIYVATNLGFNEIKSDKIHTISEENGLINSEVQTIISDHAANIWMGTMGGLARFQEKTDQYRDFNEEEGLFDLRIHSLVADKFDNIWIATNNGLYRYILASDTIIRVQGIQTGSKLINSLLFYNDSTLIIGTALGFDKITFDSQLQRINRQVNYDKQNGFRFSENNLNAICNDEQNHVWLGPLTG
jgi:ligand-binding sensor domain-containing protein